MRDEGVGMGRKGAWKRGRLFSVILAGGIGYLLGGLHAAPQRSIDLSPAQTVALRFPEDKEPASAVDATPIGSTGAMVLGEHPQLVVLSPEPMIPPRAPQPAAEIAEAAPATAPERADPKPLPVAPRPAVTTARPTPATKAAAPARHPASRSGFVLNDAQIASIKQRLHLTADQEQMWPAVEAALRNLAYMKARDARRRGAPAGGAEYASADPDSAEVQGLKSAAIPLLMSFSAEQKNEVRSLAHVMGLDNLASQL